MPKRSDVIATTSRVVLLARSGLISTAWKLFDGMPERDAVAWNAMLAGYSCAGHPRRALALFSSLMRASDARPDPFSLSVALAASAGLRDPGSGRQLHGLLLRLGLQSSLPVANSLLDCYGKCRRPSDATKLFEEMEERNEVSWCSLLHGFVNSGQFDRAHDLFDEMPTGNVIAWNTLIMGHSRSGGNEISIGLFKKMQISGTGGDFATFSSLMNACAELSDPRIGRMIHAVILRTGWDAAVEVSNSVLSFYAKFGFRDDASKVFESMGHRSQVSWNAMIDANMKSGDVEGALSLFGSAPETNIVSWTATIAGLTRNGFGEEALALFLDMRRSSLGPDDFTFGAVLHACATLAVLGNGRMVHGCVIRGGFRSYVYVANGLVNMYAKCGDIDGSRQVFDGIPSRDLVSWNAMLFGYAQHGRATEALEVFEDMLSRDVSPDKVTFIGLLMACSHSGLVEQGKALLEMMQRLYGVEPDADHVTCVVDMLGRAGRLSEACALLERMADPCEALLSACAVRGEEMVMGRKAAEELLSVEPQREVGYVMLSNMYCASEQWREAEEVRKAMVERGVKKAPGCSWIEVRDTVTVFVSGSRSLDSMVFSGMLPP